jgi:hypothetical protein
MNRKNKYERVPLKKTLEEIYYRGSFSKFGMYVAAECKLYFGIFKAKICFVTTWRIKNVGY